jgi:hypothetical protein
MIDEPSKPLPVEPLVYHRDTEGSRIIYMLGIGGLVVGGARLISGATTLWYYGFFGLSPTGRVAVSYLTSFERADGIGLIIFGSSLCCAAISILRYRYWAKLLLQYSEQCALGFYLLREIAYRIILLQHNQNVPASYKVYLSLNGLTSLVFAAVFPVVALALIEAKPIATLFGRTDTENNAR